MLPFSFLQMISLTQVIRRVKVDYHWCRESLEIHGSFHEANYRYSVVPSVALTDGKTRNGYSFAEEWKQEVILIKLTTMTLVRQVVNGPIPVIGAGEVLQMVRRRLRSSCLEQMLFKWERFVVAKESNAHQTLRIKS